MSAVDTQGSVFEGGTATLMARVLGADAAAIAQADLDSIEYSIYLLDDASPSSRTAVTGHGGVSLAVADVVYDELQTDDRWTEDATGYNFRHTIDVSSDDAFAAAGRRCLVEYTLTPVSGQVILVRFKLLVV